MNNSGHTFHIPVMGTGHSIDTAIRVAPFGINSVLSLVDDLLLERIRKFYCEKYSFEYKRIGRFEEDGRARRTTAYLDMVHDIVELEIKRIRSLPFFEENDKLKYFSLLPESSALKVRYNELLKMEDGADKNAFMKQLSADMAPGSIDVNIMVKLDKVNHSQKGLVLADEFSDAKSALRGFALSKVKSSMIFSAGINQTLFTYMSKFKGFYRDASGEIQKKIILKVSDWRSILVQGKFMAKKGLEVAEFRIESGLNCGGHAFASNGLLLPVLLKEIQEKKGQLASQFKPQILKYYEKNNMPIDEKVLDQVGQVTVQGGIGTYGEDLRLRKDFGMQMTGWASPFLLVPEATPVDETTRVLMAEASQDQYYLSDVSPLGVPFNNIHLSGSENWTNQRIEEGKPGSPCPKKFLISNSEFSELPICTASREYQKQKLETIAADNTLTELQRSRIISDTLVKTCICDHLGNGALIALGVQKESNSPQSICPGSNLAWFNEPEYSLKDMIDHIYGRRESLVPKERPHMFARELTMYVDHFQKLVDRMEEGDKRQIKTLNEFRDNLAEGMEYLLLQAEKESYQDENLASIAPIVAQERLRLSESGIILDAKSLVNATEQ